MGLHYYKSLPDRSEDNGEQELMQTRTKPKRQQLCEVLRRTISLYRLQIYMPVQEAMHRLIPQSIELLKSRGIPPILIELSVSKLRELPSHISNILEHNVKQKDLQYEEGQDASQEQLEK